MAYTDMDGGGDAHTNTVVLSLKKENTEEKMSAPPTRTQKCNLRRRHLTVTNQIRSVIEFSISAKLIRKRKHNNCEWHISEGGDFKEQHQGTPDASSC